MIKCSAKNREAIRKYISAALFYGVSTEKAKKEKFDINEFVKDFHRKTEGKILDPIVALDTVRLVPVLTLQVLMASPELMFQYMDKGLNIGEVQTLMQRYKDVNELKSDLGLDVTLGSFKPQRKPQIEDNPPIQEKPKPVTVPDLTSYDANSLVLRSRLHENKNETKEQKERNENTLYNLTKLFEEQSEENNITSGREMVVPGLDTTGIALFVGDAKAFKSLYPAIFGSAGIQARDGDIYMIVTDVKGTPIKFDKKGNVDPNGQIVYYRTIDMPAMYNGKVAVTKEELSKANPTNYQKILFGDVQKLIKKLVSQQLSGIKRPTPKQKEKAEKYAINRINEQYKILGQITSDLNAKGLKYEYMMADIVNITGNRLLHNNYSLTPLSKFNKDDITEIFIAKEDTAEQYNTVAENQFYFLTSYTKEPVPISKPHFKDTPFLDMITKLLVEPIYEMVGNKLQLIPTKTRKKYIDQYLLISKALSYDIDLKENIDQKTGKPKINLGINGKAYVLDYTKNTPSAIKDRQDRIQEIKNLLSKPYLTQTLEDFYPNMEDKSASRIQNELSSKEKRSEAEQFGAVFHKIDKYSNSQNLKSQVERAMASANSTKENYIVISRPDGSVSVIYINFPKLSINKDLVNKPKNFFDLTISEKDGQLVLDKKKGDYREFLLNNFSTVAVANAEGRVTESDNNIVYSVREGSTEKVKREKKETSEKDKAVITGDPAVNPFYEGKVVYITEGSGSEALADENSNVITEANIFATVIKRDKNLKNKLKEGANAEDVIKVLNKLSAANKATVFEKAKIEIAKRAAEGNTVVLNNVNFLELADVAFLQINPEILKNNSNDTLSEKEQDKIAELEQEGIKVNSFNIDGYAEDVFKAEPVSVERKPEPKKKPEPPKPSNKPALGEDTSDEDIDNVLLEKNDQQKQYGTAATTEQIAAAKRWYENHPLSKYFPYEVLVKAVNVRTPGPIATWAIHGIKLYTYYNADGSINKERSADYTDLYHEAWHGFTQTFLTKEQKEKLYAEARKRKGSFTAYNGVITTFENADVWQLEEYLAEDFRRYMLSGGKTIDKEAPVKNSIFRKIFNFLKELFGVANPSDVVNNPLGFDSINELYEKLRIGDISMFSFNSENRDKTIGVLNKTGIKPTQKVDGIEQLNYQDSNLIVKTIDSIMSDIVNDLVKRSGENRLTVEIFSNKKKLGAAYLKTYRRLKNDVLANLNDELQAKRNSKKGITPEEESAYIRKIELLEFVLNNFGDYNNLDSNVENGVIAWHLSKSKFINEEDLSAIYADEEEAVTPDSISKKAGNEVSVINQAAPEIKYLLKSLHKYDEDNNPVLNELGVQDLTESYVAWNKIVRTTKGKLDKVSMFEALKKAAAKDPVINELLGKIGKPTNQTGKAAKLWLGFWQTFCKANIPLLQLNVKTTVQKAKEEGEEDVVTFKTTFGSSSSEFRKTITTWEKRFNSKITDFIKKEEDDLENFNRHYLDLPAIIDKYYDPTERKIKDDMSFIDFFNDIGVRLSYNDDIQREVEFNDIGKPNQLIKKLNALYLEGYEKLYDLKGVFNSYDVAGAKKNDNHLLNALASLEGRYSDSVSTFNVTNANGDSQYEQSLHNTISIIVDTINNANSYADLIALPHMRHFDMDVNPWVRQSKFFNSLFDLESYEKQDKYSAKDKKLKGLKRQGIGEGNNKINLTNLSGASIFGDKDKAGVDSASADRYTKLMMDFHSMLLQGKHELWRHADKSTSYMIFLDKIFGRESDKHYIATTNFFSAGDAENGSPIVPGYEELYEDYFRGYLDAEIERISKLKSISRETQLKYDPRYLKQGQNLILFEDIIYDKKVRKRITDTIDKILKERAAKTVGQIDFVTLDDVLGADGNEDLESKIIENINNYFERQFNDLKNEFVTNNLFIDSDLVTETLNAAEGMNADENLSNYEQTTDALMRSYVANTMINHIEAATLIYGDIAAYNLAKEENHKRNAGFGSTGQLFATDIDSINYVNSLGRKWAAKRSAEDPEIKEKKLAEDGSFDTGILEDNIVRSKNYEQLFESVKASEIEKAEQRFANDKKKLAEFIKNIDQKVSNALKEYTKMNEGDGQGWLTFDFYRVLSILQGEWTDAQEDLYNDIVNGVHVDKIEVLNHFPPRKLQYAGVIKLDDDFPPINAFHKFSLAPLIPNVIEGTNLQKLHDRMMRNGIDYATFESGSKLSNVIDIVDGKQEKNKFYSDKNTKTLDEGAITPNTLFLHYLKDQLKIDAKFKRQVTITTQMRKLIENGFMDVGVPVDYMKGTDTKTKVAKWSRLGLTDKEFKQLNGLITIRDFGSKFNTLYNKREAARLRESDYYKYIKEYENDIINLTTFKLNKLKKEMNLEVKNGNVILNKKLQDFLVAELGRQGLADHEIAFIRTNENGGLAHDLSISVSAEKIEKALTSIIVKRLVRQKINGEALVQVSRAGWEYQVASETDDLPFYVRNGAGEGRTSAMKVKITLQGDFLNLLYLKHNDKKPIGTRARLNEMLKNEEWLNTGNNRRMITLLGARIPVQLHNSMEFAEVYEFLDPAAGNIVILPSEIVAKSGGDFDIDKITFMMPNISSNINWKHWTSDRGRKELFKLGQEDPDGMYLDLSNQNVERIIENRKNPELSDEDRTVLNFLRKYSPKFSTLNEKLDTEEGLENKFLASMQNLLSLDETFVSLVTPNSTDLIKSIADDLANYVSTYNQKRRLDPEYKADLQRFKDLKAKDSSKLTSSEEKELTELDERVNRISGTKPFEILYNIFKHTSNNIGKQTLGLGAVDNTYNSIFDRIGAVLAPYEVVTGEYYDSDKKDYVEYEYKKRIDLLFKHNKVRNVNNEEVISLSNLYDANNENNISFIISQMLNGWVDVAKDSWIFNIQGNKEVAGTLLFMIQAGVPLKQAIYFVSQPIVREYIKLRRLAGSTFAQAMGTKPDYEGIKPAARRELLERFGVGNELAISDELIYKTSLSLTNKDRKLGKLGSQLAFFDENKVEANMFKKITDFAKSGTLTYDKNDLAIFLHFLEVEQLADKITDVKQKTNFDTSKTDNLFDAYNKVNLYNALAEENVFSDDFIDSILRESPIGSFYIQEFQLDTFKDFFKLNSDPTILSVLSTITEDVRPHVMKKLYGKTETYIKKWRNTLPAYIYINEQQKLDIDTIKSYKGIEINSAKDEDRPVKIDVVKGKRVLFVDKDVIKEDYEYIMQIKDGTEEDTLDDNQRFLLEAFPTLDSYAKYLLEREILRDRLTRSDTWSDYKTRLDIQMLYDKYNKVRKRKNETPEARQERITGLVLEDALRDLALEESQNFWHMFNSYNTMADKLIDIQITYPELVKKYLVLQTLGISTDTINGQRVSNIVLTDANMEQDLLNIYHENILTLSDSTKLDINASQEEKDRVAKFFKDLAVYSIYQNGFNTSGTYALNRIVDQSNILLTLEGYVNNFMKNMNFYSLDKFTNEFTRFSEDKKLRYRIHNLVTSDYDPAADKAQYEKDDANGTTDVDDSNNTSLKNMVDQGLDRPEISIALEYYNKDTAPNNPDVGYIFTENAEMLDTDKDVSMTQAVIRVDREGNKNPNALPIITKKKQAAGANWIDTDIDYKEFKRLNAKLIKRIKESGYKKLVFPEGFATEKAKLPYRFALWLQKELYNNFGLVTELNESQSGLISQYIEEPVEKPTPEFDKLPAKSDTPTMRYAGIGSRETPDEVGRRMTRLAKFLAERGYTLRSGAAKGADQAFEKGATKKEIFEGKAKTGDVEKAVAHEIHPNLQGVMDHASRRAFLNGRNPKEAAAYAENVMARNTNQIFGKDLDTPVDFVVCYDPSGWEGEGKRPFKGGTLQAIDMAARKGIPVINMANEGWEKKLMDLLGIKETAKPTPTPTTTPTPSPTPTAVSTPTSTTPSIIDIVDMMTPEVQKDYYAASLSPEEIDLVLVDGNQFIIDKRQMPNRVKKGFGIYYAANKYSNNIVIQWAAKPISVPGFEDLKLVMIQDTNKVFELTTGLTITTLMSNQKDIINELKDKLNKHNVREVIEKTPKLAINKPGAVITQLFTKPGQDDWQKDNNESDNPFSC